MCSGDHFKLAITAVTPKAAIILPWEDDAFRSHPRMNPVGKTWLEHYLAIMNHTSGRDLEHVKFIICSAVAAALHLQTPKESENLGSILPISRQVLL